ncbi:MAG: translation elongation factor Ts [Anaerolineae bacterium]|nr:translation elongation factor Ts [Anaerolineae bacterium]
MVKELREATAAGVLDCRKALETHDGDLEAAAAFLREKGLAKVAKRTDRTASEGIVEVYGHPGNRVGVMLEVNCETDFVARTDEFRALAHDLVLHIAFAAPQYLARQDVPAAVLDAEKQVFRAQALEEGKPEHIIEKIVEGKVEKFYQTVCLMEQPFVKDEERMVEEIVKDYTAKLGERVVVRRFVRYELGK